MTLPKIELQPFTFFEEHLRIHSRYLRELARAGLFMAYKGNTRAGYPAIYGKLFTKLIKLGADLRQLDDDIKEYVRVTAAAWVKSEEARVFEEERELVSQSLHGVHTELSDALVVYEASLLYGATMGEPRAFKAMEKELEIIRRHYDDLKADATLPITKLRLQIEERED